MPRTYTFKKFLAKVMTFVLTVASVLALVPSGAFAAANDTITIDDTTDSTVTVGIYTDSSREVELGDQSVTTDQTLYGKWNIEFSTNQKPGTDHGLKVEYKLPSNITVDSDKSGTLYEKDGTTRAGVWELDKKTKTILLTYDESWATSPDHTAKVEAHINFEFTLADDGLNENTPAEVKFPGTGTITKINITEGNVEGYKSSSLDADNQAIVWTITLEPKTDVTNLTVSDTIGSNLTFVEDSFKLDGNTVSATVGGKDATISLNSVNKGKHTLTYSTKVSDEAWNAALAGDGNLANSGNTASWTWGASSSNHKGQTTGNPPQVTRNIVSKAAGTGTNDNIKWVVTINNGSVKEDLSGYTFTDAIDENQEYKGSYKVCDSNWQQVGSGTLNGAGTSFTYTFGDNAGKNTYYIEYYTQIKEDSTDATVSNTAKVKDKEGTEFTSTNTYGVQDTNTYIEKSFVADGSDTAKGTANWQTMLYFSKMAANTTKATYTDSFQFDNKDSDFSYSNVVLKAGDDVLVENSDYTIKQTNGHKFTITFEEDCVAKLVGKTDVVLTYTTQSTTTTNGTYKNEGQIKTNLIEKSAYDTYTVNEETTPNVLKKSSDSDSKAKWDKDFDWSKIDASDTTKGAWVTTWTVDINRLDWYSSTSTSDLHGNDVVLTDDLAGMTYVPGSASYRLIGFSGFSSLYNISTIPSISDSGSAVFTMKTNNIDMGWGDPQKLVNDSGAWYGYVELTYKTAVKASDAGIGKVTKTNTASAEAGNSKFDAGQGTVTIDNSVLDKSSSYNSTDAVVEYKVKINPKGIDLVANSDELTLVDTLDATGSFITSSFVVSGADGKALSSSDYKLSLEDIEVGGTPKTKLTITVKDGTPYTVTYSVKPVGKLNDEVLVTNNAEFSGVSNSATSNSKKYKVANASGGTSATAYGITVDKYDGATLAKLEGATFTLYEVNLDADSLENAFKEVKTRTAKTDANGKVTFGVSASDRLDTDRLYAVKETAAPSGYKLSTIVKYAVLRDNNDDADYAKILEKAKTLGIDFISNSSSMSFSNTKSETAPATTDINISKTVNGNNPQDNEEFSFEISAKTEGAPMPTNTTVTTKGAAVSSFEGLEFTEEGTYEYTIHETTNAGDGWTNAGDITAKVVVAPGEDGVLVATVDYTGSASEDSYVFNNTYAPKAATATIKISKEVIGTNANANEQFKFELFDADSKSLGEVTCKGGETKSFTDLTFSKAGTYTYTIKETSDLGYGWSNETGNVTATVTVSQNKETGNLEAKVEYTSHLSDDATVALITNKYEAPKSAEPTISVSKKVAGDNPKEDETFTFELQDKDGKKVEGVDTITLKADETKSFEGLKLNEEGTFTYTIHETSENGEGWTNAQDVTATVVVKYNKDTNAYEVESVTYSLSKDGDNSAFFENQYEAPTTPSSPDAPKTEDKPKDEKPKEEKPSEKKALPQTGDTTSYTLVVALAAVGGASVLGGVALNRRKNNR